MQHNNLASKAKQRSFKAAGICAILGSSFFMMSTALAAKHGDGHGNEGYDTAAECDAAVAAGTAKFYRPHTTHEPLKRAGEADVKVQKLSDLTAAKEAASALGYDAAGYTRGACDIGVGRSQGRDGVSAGLIGKYIPYGPEMAVNVYYDAAGKAVRASMKQCDNNFSGNMPRPVGAVTKAEASECFANVQIPAKFETKTEQVVKVPATKRFEPIAATFKTVSEQVLVSPEMKRQIPVPATYKTVSEEVVIQPATTRDEPVPATYKMVSERVLVKAESKRIEVTPPTYKTVSEQVLVTPAQKVLKAIPAEYVMKDEEVVDRPATTRVETVPATFKTVTEQVLSRPESVRYEPIAVPLRTVREEVERTAASSRLQVTPAVYKTVTERVLVKEAGKRLVEVPATYETVTERVKIADATKEWKRGRAYIGQAVEVRPLRGFVVGADGKVAGNRVEVSSAANPAGGRGVVDTQIVAGNNSNLDDDVMCLVAIPEQFQIITRQVVKTPASVREVEIPAEYATVTRQELVTAASSSEIAIPATMQTVTRQEIDIDKLKAAGYKFDDKGNIIATPSGERVLRAASLRTGAAGVTAANAVGKGAESGEEGYVREIKIPAVYQTVSRQVIDQPATVRTIEVPGTMKTIKTRIEAAPARTEESTIPAVYRTQTRQVVDQAATQREIVIPAEYRNVERRVVDTPATTRKIPVAAVTQTVQRRVVDTPASMREETIPAVYRTVTRQVIDQAASLREISVPAQYDTISYQVKTADARTENRAILCETNATPAKIMEIQRALSTAGFNPGPVNGVLRESTMRAVNGYQQSKGLPVDGFLNLETVKSLGVSPN
ncbi:peptidoglycan-binding domain-containing protein [Variovorax sp. PCZ-1]|uniref:peptidoglycan-binding domain-containing protein n=1 Tax=Variovorax sp. PCZ-1 TaxID=2835533 RepID=UPI001BCF24F7|nr:peptidoglycan-binding domain-containing protein [Variovorax sp. PCZ-1]MBS7807528.1 peptidoglycan-binding protein [Variovorax sp. PCZ-1]